MAVHPVETIQAVAAEVGAELTARQVAEELDARDEFRQLRSRFAIPPSKAGPKPSIYLCGNSLGCMPLKAKDYVVEQMDKWAATGVDGHFEEPFPWVTIDESVRDGMARIVGAQPQEVCVMNSLTVNLHLMMVAFYRPTSAKFKVLVEAKAFPSDAHMLESQVRHHGLDPEEAIIKIGPREGEVTIRTEDVLNIIQSDQQLALVLMSGVQYYTGQRFDLKTITAAAREANVPVGWDLAHAVGNVPLSLHDDDVDFACWCSYKYLNSGPGGIAGCFVNERHGSAPDLTSGPRFAGWWGHRKSDRFDMSHTFIPSTGAQGFMLSNPPVICCSTLRASLEVFDEAGGVQKLRSKSEVLTAYLEALIDSEVADHVTIFTPRDVAQRGCQLSLTFKNGVSDVFDKLSAAGVVCDVRKPDVMRIAPTPLYNSFCDVWDFIQLLKKVLEA
eukprot:CAMPEP_0118966414 /NCGR_PEP_ID=MMETSP1173-20130426/3888_1 /TAXON_ID=1034831 /ORGANISM="Rhizochromulina marina cf, Strain CCMP1243" /LENGTH=442 /DNA_ID=CAMNT_0006915191 /DNA_START=27 /DNA_END=1355 /DNA_ORIENTATION=-